MTVVIDSGSLAGWDDRRGQTSAKQLKNMLDEHLPDGTEQLLIFSQCYGGNMAHSDHFKDREDTTVLSGTGVGQEGAYGGYNDDAARALGPGKGKTAKDVHDAGKKGKADKYAPDKGYHDPDNSKLWDEEPTNTGAKDPGDFSLESTKEEGPIHSRHIVVYAGQPQRKKVRGRTVEGHTELDERIDEAELDVGDDMDRDTIKDNFNGQPNTTVETCGGEPDPNDESKGQNGWDHPGTPEGLKDAIKNAAKRIKEAGDDKIEQFILFVTDHGFGETLKQFEERRKKVEKVKRTSLADPFKSFGAGSSYAHHIMHDKQAIPGFRVALNFEHSPFDIHRDAAGKFIPRYKSGDFELEIAPVGKQPIHLAEFSETALEIGTTGRLGDTPGDELNLYFPMKKDQFVNQTFGSDLAISLLNNSNEDVFVTTVAQSTGAIAKSGGPDPSRKKSYGLLRRILDWLWSLVRQMLHFFKNVLAGRRP